MDNLWAKYAPLNFRFVPDDGTKWGDVWEPIQGSTRFGDIRLYSKTMASNVLGAAEGPTNGSTASGDIFLNSYITYRIGAGPDLFSCLLHESGHSLGMDHSTTGTVMYGAVWGIYSDLTQDDIAGIQYIYGARRPDAYDQAAANDTLASATSLQLAGGTVKVMADLTSIEDRDYFMVRAPSDATGALSVSLDAKSISLLAPKLTLYSAQGTVLGTQSADYGQIVNVTFNAVAPGQTFLVEVDGSTTDVFGMGAYYCTMTFAVSGARDPAPDATAPTVVVTSPTSGTVSGRIALAATATDNVGITRVDFLRGSVLIGTDLASPYETTLDTTTLPNGALDLTARAYDAAGNNAAYTVSVVVSNADTTAPSASISSPAAGATVSGSTTIQASASDDGGVAKVDFYVDGNLIGTDSTSPYGVAWSSSSVPDGTHSLTAKASDLSGNETMSATIGVVVANAAAPGDTQPPTPPSSLTVVKSTTKGKVMARLSWTAARDNVGVSGYHVYRNGVRIATVSTASYTDTAVQKRTSYSYYVTAFDAAGNESAASTAAALSI